MSDGVGLGSPDRGAATPEEREAARTALVGGCTYDEREIGLAALRAVRARDDARLRARF